jgi:hypothetical protein
MISETEIYTGAVLARLAVQLEKGFSIKNIPELGSSYFRVGKRGGLHIKYCQNRLSPWVFTFTPEQQQKLHGLSEECANVVVALVCERIGIVGLSLGDTHALIEKPENIRKQATITVSKRPRQQYSFKGSHGELDRKVAENELANWVLGSLGDA